MVFLLTSVSQREGSCGTVARPASLYSILQTKGITVKFPVLSPSFAVSVAALVVATAGGGIAATTLITGKQIKDGTVAKADLTPPLRKQINTRPLRGIPGAPGLQGLPGVPGGFDPGKVTYVVGPSTVMNPGDTVIVKALCPAATKAIGGGYFTEGRVEANIPINNGTGWQTLIWNDTGIVTTTNAASAICAAA